MTTISGTLRQGIALNANDRHHWREWDRRRRAIHAVYSVAARGLEHLPEPCHLTVTVVHPRRNRRRDATNWAPTAKVALDAIVGAGLLTDDHNGIVTATTFVAAVDPEVPGGHVRLDLTFEEA